MQATDIATSCASSSECSEHDHYVFLWQRQLVKEKDPRHLFEWGFFK